MTKVGSIRRLDDGTMIIRGCTFDCEGEPMDPREAVRLATEWLDSRDPRDDA